MDFSYIKNRIAALREQKGISEIKMSYELGHSRTYINHLMNEKSQLKMKSFLEICDYLEIEPKDFFDDEMDNAPAIRKALEGLKKLSDADVQLVLSLIERLPPDNHTEA